MPLPPSDLLNLITIRTFFALGGTRAAAGGAVNRQAAVILLDAVIDRTVFTAAERLGRSFRDSDGVDRPLAALIELGWTPGAGVETARRRLRRVRNGVQHAGTGVDAVELPGWVVSTRQLIDEVVRFAFEVELATVRYADGIANVDVRELLSTAEADLALGRLDSAIRAILGAYERVFAVWQRFAIASRSALATRHPTYLAGIGPIGGDDAKMVALQEIALLTAISPEPGEALWFLEAVRESMLLQREEVERALTFVFTLAVAVEASPAVQRADRREREAARRRRVRSDRNAHARIASYRFTDLGDELRFILTLEEVPDDGLFREWSRVVQADLDRLAGEPGRYWLHDDGTIDLVDDGSGLSAALDVVQEVLSGAEAAIEERRSAAANSERSRTEAKEQFRARVDSSVPSGLPDWLRFESHHDVVPGEGFSVIVYIAPSMVSAHDERLRTIVESLGTTAWPMDGARLVTSLEPDVIPAFAGALVPAVEALLVERRAEVEAQQQRLQPFVDEFARRGIVNDRSS